MNKRQFFSQINGSVLGTVATLSVIGLINLYSATSVWGEQGISPAFYSQILWMILGWGLCFLFILIDYHVMQRAAYLFYFVSLAGLAAVLVWGQTVSGHQSWLKIGSFGIQPSEFAKIAFILAIAKYFSEHLEPVGYGFRELLFPLLIVAAPLALILLEGDLGSTLFFALTFASLILFVGVKKKTLAFLTGISLVTVISAYFFVLNPYQQSRIQTFLQPGFDPRGQGYQLIQSKIAVGSGMLTGKGYMQGMQNKLLYLPEKHTDFIFPVLAEEWGFIGSALAVLLYFGLLMAGTKIAAKARDSFGMLLAYGIMAWLFWQVSINVGGVLGLLPLTGVTLPLLSYGGSSLVTVFIGVGMLLNIGRRRHMF